MTNGYDTKLSWYKTQHEHVFSEAYFEKFIWVAQKIDKFN